MSDRGTVISVRGLGKRYRLGVTLSHNSLRDWLVHRGNAIWRRLRRNGQSLGHPPEASYAEPGILWALRGVSFNVKRGEVVGIIGRNGAGKSTLLKILSQITEPTEGEVRMRGRVGSLLEVGTGMHPELSGRENVFMNGAILGMRNAEIIAKYDQIVDFAGIESFMSTPIKRYSSGMRVRLGFAIAAHLELSVLLVDEVLAVGDAAFRKKCLGKMGDVAKEGRTVLFVSHNMAAIEKLCSRAVLLDEGQVVRDDTTKETIACYLSRVLDPQTQDLSDYSKRRGTGAIRIVGISLRDGNDRPIAVAQCGETLRIVLTFVKLGGVPGRCINVSIFCETMMGAPVFLQHNRMAATDFGELPDGGGVCV